MTFLLHTAGVKWTARCLSPVPPRPRSRHSPLRHSDVTQSCCDLALKSCLRHQLSKSELPHLKKTWILGSLQPIQGQDSTLTPPPATLRHHLLKPSHGKLAGKRHFPKPKSPLNLYFLTWKINLTTVRCSASKRNHWILAKCKILGMPCAFPVCQHMEWAINGPFHHLDSSAAQNIPPPLSWHWYHIPSFQKKSQLDGKREKLDFQHGYYH